MSDQTEDLTKDCLSCSSQKQMCEERANVFPTFQNTEASLLIHSDLQGQSTKISPSVYLLSTALKYRATFETMKKAPVVMAAERGHCFPTFLTTCATANHKQHFF